MPMLYGEGEKAFLRLQEEIMKQSDDQSLFAWLDPDAPPDSCHGLLAKSPSNFRFSSGFFPYQDRESRPPYSMSNRGLQIDLPITRIENDVYVAALDCPVPPAYEDSRFLAIFLRRLDLARIDQGEQQFARIRLGHFGQVREGCPLKRIHVRQTIALPASHGVYPRHILQLRKGPDPEHYRVRNIISPSAPSFLPRLSSSTPHPAWLQRETPTTYQVAKSGNHLACAIFFEHADRLMLLVMLGSRPGFDVGFDAQEISAAEESLSLESIQDLTMPLIWPSIAVAVVATGS